MARSSAQRRYVLRLAAAMAAYLVTFAVARPLIGSDAVTGLAAGAVALVPAACIASVFWALSRLLVEEHDEYLRMLLVRAVLVASAITLSVMTVWGTLADFGVIEAPRSYYVVWLFFIGIALGEIVNRRKHGAATC